MKAHKFRLRECGNFKTSYHAELAIFRTDLGRLLTVLGIIILFLIPFIGGASILSILNMVWILAIAAMGLNLLTGYTGQISLCHGALFGVGAYTEAILVVKVGIPPLLTLPIAGASAAAVGTLFALPAARVKGLYLCVTTLAGQMILDYLLTGWVAVTGGREGITLPHAWGSLLDLNGEATLFYAALFCFILTTWISVNLVHTKTGRAFTAIRDNERGAEGMGISVSRYKLISFAIASLFAGLAGALYTCHVDRITPEHFSFWLSLQFVAMITAGGLGTIPGPGLGAIFFILIDELLALLPESSAGVGPFAGGVGALGNLFYGLVAVVVIIYQPRGLTGILRLLRSGFRFWNFSYSIPPLTGNETSSRGPIRSGQED